MSVSNLGTYPSDGGIKLIAEVAAQETDSLLTLLGLVPSQLHQMQKSHKVMLPGIDSWFKLGDNDFEDLDDGMDDDKSDEESLSEAQELQELLDHKEDRTLL
jgi:hypothetical protein